MNLCIFREKHCNSVSFGPESTHQGALPRHYPARFALGFNDGALEVYSIRYEHENGAYAIQVCLLLHSLVEIMVIK